MLEKHYVPKRCQRARTVLTFFAHNLNPAIMRRWFLKALSAGDLALGLFA